MGWGTSLWAGPLPCTPAPNSAALLFSIYNFIRKKKKKKRDPALESNRGVWNHEPIPVPSPNISHVIYRGRKRFTRVLWLIWPRPHREQMTLDPGLPRARLACYKEPWASINEHASLIHSQRKSIRCFWGLFQGLVEIIGLQRPKNTCVSWKGL